MDFSVVRGFLLLCIICVCRASTSDSSMTYDILYTRGVEAYNKGDWSNCLKFISAAVADKRKYENVLTECRLSCQQNSKTDIDASKFLDLAFFDLSLKKSSCLRKCKREKLGPRPEVTIQRVEDDFQRLEQYNYLQLCAYKVRTFINHFFTRIRDIYGNIEGFSAGVEG